MIIYIGCPTWLCPGKDLFFYKNAGQSLDPNSVWPCIGDHVDRYQNKIDKKNQLVPNGY